MLSSATRVKYSIAYQKILYIYESNATALWEQVLDSDGSGDLSSEEFCAAVKKLVSSRLKLECDLNFEILTTQSLTHLTEPTMVANSCQPSRATLLLDDGFNKQSLNNSSGLALQDLICRFYPLLLLLI